MGQNLVIVIGKAQAPYRNNTFHAAYAYVYIGALNARRPYLFPLIIETPADGFGRSVLPCHIQFYTICNIIAGVMVIVGIAYLRPRYRRNGARRACRGHAGIEETQVVTGFQTARTGLYLTLEKGSLARAQTFNHAVIGLCAAGTVGQNKCYHFVAVEPCRCQPPGIVAAYAQCFG